MIAYIKHSGQQFKVEEDAVITVDNLNLEVGESIEITDIPLVIKDNNDIEVSPTGTVKAEVVENFRGDKIIVFKMKKKKNYKRTRGHKQPFTKIKITSIDV